MANNYKQPGKSIAYTNTGVALTSGQPVAIGSMMGVALNDIAQNETGDIMLEGVFTLPKGAGAIDVGDSLALDAGLLVDDSSATSGALLSCAVAVSPALDGDSAVTIKIVGAPCTVKA